MNRTALHPTWTVPEFVLGHDQRGCPLTPGGAVPTESLNANQSELHAATSGAWSDYLAGRHTELLAGLPALMADTRRAASVLAGDHAAEAAGLLATSYRIAAGLSGRLGLVDLGAHAAHRALDTARFTTRPELDEAGALRYLVWVLVRQGDLAGAERIAVRAAERLDGGLLAQPDRDRIGVFGSLLMNAASAASRQGAPGRAEDLLRVASAAAARLGVDRTDEAGMLGPRIAAMQAVDQAIDAGEPDRAMQLATQVPDATGPVAPFWESGHRLHLAAACADLERWSDVVEHLAGRPAAGTAMVAGPAAGPHRRRPARRAPRTPLRTHHGASRALRDWADQQPFRCHLPVRRH